MDLTQKQYIDYKVYGITEIKKKYGFRVALVYSDGKTTTQQLSGFKTKKEANKKREQTIAELYNGTYVVERKIKLSDYLNEWLENEMRPRITSDTYNTYSNVIRRHIIPAVGNLYLETLTSGHIKKLYNHIAEYSSSTPGIAKTIMNTSLRFAEGKKLISFNPAIGVDLPKNIKKKPYHATNIDIKKTLNQEQISKLIEASKDSPIHMQVLFAVLMGLRRGEINGLKYSDVDFIHRKLHVQRQLGKSLNKSKEEIAPKTITKQEIKTKTESSNRVLDIPDMVFEAILEERKKYEKNRSRRKKEFQDLDYICCSTYGRPRSRQFNFQPYKKLLRENDLPDIRWHDLRHSYATLLLKNDFSLKAVSQTMGHAREIVTADFYGDNSEIIADCVSDIKDFMNDVLPIEAEAYSEQDKAFDYSEFNPCEAIETYFITA